MTVSVHPSQLWTPCSRPNPIFGRPPNAPQRHQIPRAYPVYHQSPTACGARTTLRYSVYCSCGGTRSAPMTCTITPQLLAPSSRANSIFGRPPNIADGPGQAVDIACVPGRAAHAAVPASRPATPARAARPRCPQSNFYFWTSADRSMGIQHLPVLRAI